MTRSYSAERLFQELNGTHFQTYRELQEGVCRVFNKHVTAFPPQYTYRHALELGEVNRWVVRDDGRGYVVRYDPVGNAVGPVSG